MDSTLVHINKGKAYGRQGKFQHIRPLQWLSQALYEWIKYLHLDESMIEITASSEGLEKRVAGAIYKM